MRIVPDVTVSSPANIRRVVDFPQPEPPTNTTSSPSAIARSSSDTMVWSPNFLVTRSKVIDAMSALDPGACHTRDEVALEERVGDDDRHHQHHGGRELDAHRAGAAAQREHGEQLRHG